jgi:hypothetical protein
MRTICTVATALALAALATGREASPAPVTFELNPSASSFSWIGSTNQGPLTGASQTFHLRGTMSLALSSDGRGGHTGRFTGGNAAIQPGIFGGFKGVASSFVMTDARLDFVSESFRVAPDGSFTTTLHPTFLDGLLSMAPPLGPSTFLFLDGRRLERVVVSGTLSPTESSLRLTAPITLEYEISGAAVSGSLSMPGTLVADL